MQVQVQDARCKNQESVQPTGVYGGEKDEEMEEWRWSWQRTWRERQDVEVGAESIVDCGGSLVVRWRNWPMTSSVVRELEGPNEERAKGKRKEETTRYYCRGLEPTVAFRPRFTSVITGSSCTGTLVSHL